MRLTGTSIVLLILACSTNASQDEDARPARDELAGNWAIEFSLDSMRSGDSLRRWIQPRTPPVKGRLDLAESANGRGDRSGSMTVDFRPMLGRQMSCYEPGSVDVLVTPVDSVASQVSFTPHAADCGFGGTAHRSGDTLRGTWSETSFVGPVAEGTFQMVRVR